MRLLAYLVAGAVFGAGLAISGMTDPARVLGFLDVTGTWDPTLVFVMGGALAVSAIGGRLVMRRPRPLHGGSFPGPPAHHVDRRVVLGSACFGAGWGIAGFCPGPAITNLSRLDPGVMGFVAAMVLGMHAARAVARVDSA